MRFLHNYIDHHLMELSLYAFCTFLIPNYGFGRERNEKDEGAGEKEFET